MYAKPKKKTELEKRDEKIRKFKESRLRMAKKSIEKKKNPKISVKKPKKPSVRKIHKRCDTLFSKIIRIRDKYCQHCGIEKGLQNSHTIPRSGSKYLYFDEINCIALCYKCHIHWWHKNPIEAYEWFMEKFPDRYAYIQEAKNKLASRTLEDYIKLEEKLKIRLKELENAR